MAVVESVKHVNRTTKVRHVHHVTINECWNLKIVISGGFQQPNVHAKFLEKDVCPISLDLVIVIRIRTGTL
jgi:hypothetical protein